MNNTHYKFPHIEQLRNVLTSLKHKYQNPTQVSDERKWIFDETLPLPTIEFRGTVKLHGTNAAIVFDQFGNLYTQSREKVLTSKEDNSGFCAFVNQLIPQNFLRIISGNLLNEAIDNSLPIIMFGEWCGKGIQGGVAISQLDKMFVIFAVKIGDRWCDFDEIKNFESASDRIFNISRAPEYRYFVNFASITENILNDLSEMTESVEKECPFAKTFDISGVGEGIVWTAICNAHTKDFCRSENGNPWMFKTKGEKHKNIKETKLVQLAPDIISGLDELVVSVVTEQRLEQGIDLLNSNGMDISKKSIGHFLKWVQEDINRENKDILVASGLDIKLINTAIQKATKDWFMIKASP